MAASSLSRTGALLLVLSLVAGSCGESPSEDRSSRASARSPATGDETSPDPIAALAEAMGGAASRPVTPPPAAAAPAPGGGPLAYDVPAGFEAEPPTSSMRLAQFRLPGRAGAADASLILYYFGPGSAGSTQANLQRWIGQMQPPEGSTPGANAKTRSWTTDAGLAVTQVDVEGRYVAGGMPGGGESHDDPDSRMIAAVIDTPRGAVYVKAVGPRETMKAWEGDLAAMMRSARSP